MRPAVVALVISVALHALVLAGVRGRLLGAASQPVRLLRVSLLPPGGGGEPGGGAGEASDAGPPAPPAAAAAAHVASLPAPKPATREISRAADSARRPRIAKHRRRVEHRPPPPAVAAVEAQRPGAIAKDTVAPEPGAAGDPAGDLAGGIGSGKSGAGAAGSGPGSGGGSGPGAGGGDMRARCLYCPEPLYPRLARFRGWQGTVDVSVLLLADGTVDEVSVSRSSGYEALDRAAVAVARKSRFTPPAASGLRPPVPGQIAYRFGLTRR